ncbi:MAG: HD domain-containing protein [Propionibacteriaceae bacterium]|nr:HD domain-containing protein [Propionibacteriaceae bacterium]
MAGHGAALVSAHADSHAMISVGRPVRRVEREALEVATLRDGATFSHGAGERLKPEEPDLERTCFERDRDRIIHSAAFRRLAGKTQAVVYPKDHQRTRLTHALEVAQIARSIATGVGANVILADAIALGHDCGHGPGGHAAEEAFDEFLPEGFDHGPWGADVALINLNLTVQTLDGIRNHSWSRPAPATIEGEIVSWADRISYCAHDLEDSIAAGIVKVSDIPADVVDECGVRLSDQVQFFIKALVDASCATGKVAMDAQPAATLAALRRFNYERIYSRAESLQQWQAVVDVLRALVEYYLAHPARMPQQYHAADPVRGAVSYVAGMTDRFAFEQAVQFLGWEWDSLPRGIGHGA